MIGRFACLLVLALPATLFAQPLPMPATAIVTESKTLESGTLVIATGPWALSGGTPQRSFAGEVSQTAYRLSEAGQATLDLLAPLRKALVANGFAVVYECETQTCGGFDFRYDLPVLPEPAMHINLGDFRYLAAVKQPETGVPEAVMLIVSRSANAGFVQVNRVGAAGASQVLTLSTVSEPTSEPTVSLPAAPVSRQHAAGSGNLSSILETGGAHPLDDLVFPSGAAALAPGEYASLAALAVYLAANPTRRVAIVGHTDASGALPGNIALSRRRADSVRRVLVDTLGVRPAQVEAEGVGYLSPRASNLTEAGRAANRRVEVMLVSTE
ncbi:MAG: hypothetical protein RLZZ437_1267 [Pseudomonadota bacterium]|jgi:OOP family OmpA-OmpF porin